MATLYTEPLNNLINYTQWDQLIQKTTFEAGGFMALGLTNLNATGAPQIAQGSRVEVGGSLYKCNAAEAISGVPPTAGVYYIYCVPAASSASFTYSTAAPTWDAVKGGWYSGNNRAVAKFYYTGLSAGAQYNGKVILDSYNAIRSVNTEQAIPTTGGVSVASVTTKGVNTYNLPAGAYRYSLSSGAGAGDASGKTGGTAATRDTKTGTFFWPGGNIQVLTGGDGYKGGDGGNGGAANGYGGGSGAGEASEIVGITKTSRIRAGNGGGSRSEGFAGIGGDPGPSPGGSKGTNGAGGGYGYGGGGDGGDADSNGSGGGGGGSGGSGGSGGGSTGGAGADSGYNSAGSTGGNASGGGGGGGGSGGARHGYFKESIRIKRRKYTRY